MTTDASWTRMRSLWPALVTAAPRTARRPSPSLSADRSLIAPERCERPRIGCRGAVAAHASSDRWNQPPQSIAARPRCRVPETGRCRPRLACHDDGRPPPGCARAAVDRRSGGDLRDLERERQELDAAIRRVVARNACIGCGLCTRLDPRSCSSSTPMASSRPHRAGVAGVVAEGAARTFEQACPGCRVVAVRPSGSRRHPTMGSYLRRVGGVGERRRGASSRQQRRCPHRPAPLAARERPGEQHRLGIGRFGATTHGSRSRSRRRRPPLPPRARGTRRSACCRTTTCASSDAITAKPCEISALRAAAASVRPPVMRGSDPPLVLLCRNPVAGRDRPISSRALGVPSDLPIDELWYRGRGWPGRFTVRECAR